MTHVFHRQVRQRLPVAVSGEGLYIRDAQGRAYLEASGGAAVSDLGHGHPRVIAAIKRQLDEIAYAHSGFFTTRAAEELADHLVGHAPAPLGHVYFLSGGSEAVETALKTARQYFLETGQPQRHRFISRRQSYHGNTLGALAVGGNLWRREPYAPLLMDTTLIAPCYPYRDQRADESLEEYGLRVAGELEAALLALGPDTVAAFIAEPVVGATAGALVPAPGYFKRIREICDRYGVLLIFDEVMCGMGRTGTLYACEQEGVTPDLLTVAKGLGGGYQPIGALLVADHVFAAFEQGSGALQHGHTYMAHATACAAALAVQQVIQEDRLLENVREMGRVLDRALRERFSDSPHVGDIRGRGLFQAVEFVADRATKAPFDPQVKVHARIKQEAMSRGLMVYPMGGTIDGRFGAHVLLAPPFIVQTPDILRIVDLLGDAVDAALEGLPV